MKTHLTAGKIPPRKPVIKVVCAWCRTVIRNGHAPVSHGMCAECLEGMPDA